MPFGDDEDEGDQEGGDEEDEDRRAGRYSRTRRRLGSKLIKSDLFAGKPEVFQLGRGKFELESFASVRPNGAKLR